METFIERRRTIRLRRSRLLECKLESLAHPTIKIAETTEEYCKAFKLVYNEYLHSGYTKAHPSGMLYNLWSLLPSTSVFVFKSHLDVISTMSHIRDAEYFGLPMDVVYQDKLDELRGQGRNIAEIGALATPRMRRWLNLMIFLTRAVYQYAKFSNITDIVAMVNPKHVRFYTQIFLFEVFAEERHYDKVGAPAVALRINLDRVDDALYEAYAKNNFETDLYAFFNAFGESALFQPDEEGRKRRMIDPYSAYFMFRQRPELIQSLSEIQRQYLTGLFHQNFFNALTEVPGKEEKLREAVVPILQRLHLEDKDDYTDIAFARNLGLIDYAGQRKLLQTRVAIPGLGGVGGAHLITLARSGVGSFALADFDAYSPANINRQYGSDLTSFGRSKIDVMIERALGTNPFLDIRSFRHGISEDNLDDFLSGVDIVVDSLDFFAQNIRRQLFNRALERGIPVITAAPAGYSSSVLVFMPGGMNYDRYFGVNNATDEFEQLLRFALGVAPHGTHLRYTDRRFVNLANQRVPSLDIGCQLCAGMAATEVIKIVLTGKPSSAVPASIQFDANRQVLRRPVLFWGMNGPVQRLKLAAARRLFTPDPSAGAIPPAKPGVVPVGGSIPQSARNYILAAGIAAPSGDNMQPWRFVVGERHIDLQVNRSADASFFNVRQWASLLAGGAALQNMVFAAGSLGLACRTELFPVGRGCAPEARLHFMPLGQPFHELMDEALWRRCTNRRPYSRKPLSPEVWERLRSLADKDDDALLLHCGSSGGLAKLAKAVFMADRVRVERQDLHEHLMRTIHFAPPQKGRSLPAEYRAGMPLKNLQAGLMGELYLRAVRPWRNMRIANNLGLGGLMPLYSSLCMRMCGGAGLICAKGWDEVAIMRAGRALQRVWCALEHFGFAVQPMAALTLLRLRLSLEGHKAFSAEHARLLQEAWELAREVFEPPEDHLPLLMFRTGLGGRVRHRTFRREHTELLADMVC